MTLGKIIRLNTGFDECPDNVFFSTLNCIGVKNHQCIPKPLTSKEYELKEQNSELSEKISDKDKEIDVLISVTSVLAVLCFVCLLFCIWTILRRRQHKSSGIICSSSHFFSV